VPPIYGVQFIAEDNDIASSAVTFSRMLTYLVPTVLAPAVGVLIDKWGAGKVFTLMVVLGGIIAPAPLLYWWAHTPQEQAIGALFWGQGILGLVMALTTSIYLWVIELFPVRVRATGVSFAYNLGVGVFGGLGPLICDAASEAISPQAPLSAPALFTIIANILSIAAVVASRMLAARGMMRITHIRASPY